MVNVAIVGAGGISPRHILSIKTFENANIVGIIDKNKENARNRAELCGARVFDDLSDCLDLVDMVFVLTPPSTHAEIAIKAMNAGKHVVIEKPVAASVEDAQAMVDCAAKNHVKMMVAFNMRFRQGFRKLKEFVDSGKAGDIITYWCQRQGMRKDPNNKWSTDPLLMTGMSIQSLSHDIDMMRWIAGEVVDVRAIVQETRPNLPGFDDNANAVFRMASGASANFAASWSSNLFMNTRGVIGTKGTAYIGGASLWDLDTFHWQTADMEHECIEKIKDIHDIRSFTAEDKYFIDCVDHDTTSFITGEDGLKALKISYGILESSRKNETIKLVY